MILANPRQKFTVPQFDQMKLLMQRGTSILVLLNEQGEKGAKSNMNYFLEEFGISVNSDNVIRTSFVQVSRSIISFVRKFQNKQESWFEVGFQRYYHPKEAVISTPGIISTDICPPCRFVYPFGASLNVQSPAVPLLTSSNVCFPVNRPICGFYAAEQPNQGSLAVLGSIQMFGENYLQKESNSRIGEALIKLLLSRKALHGRLDMHDANEVPEYVSGLACRALRNFWRQNLRLITYES